MSANNYLPRYFKEEGFWLKQEQKNNKKRGGWWKEGSEM